MTGANLDDLPAEIIDAVALQLPPIDCISLRLVCKSLAAKSIYAFKNVCFGTRRHMLSEYSLRGLQDLSRHEALGPAVQTLVIGTEQYEEKYADPMLNNCLAALSREQLDAHTVELQQQRSRRDSGEDIRILAAALKNMPNCRSIQIVGNHIPASTAYQHHSASEELVYHSWGARTLADRIGMYPPTVSGREKGVTGFASHVFVTVVAALAIAGETSPPILSLTMRVRYFQGVTCNALRLSPAHFPGLTRLEAFTRERARHAVRPLRELAITFDALAAVTFPPAGVFDAARESRLSFLALLPPTLTRLRLSAGYDVAHAFVHRAFADAPWFAGVETLFLNDCKCQCWDVPSAVLEACPRLRKLTLANVSVPENYFPTFLSRAARHGALEVMRVTYLMEQGGWEGADHAVTPFGSGVGWVEEVRSGAVSPFVEKVRARDGSFRALQCHRDCEGVRDHVSWAVAGTPGWGTTNIFQLRGEYDEAAIRWPDEDMFDP